MPADLIYTERLLPRWWAWIVALALVGMLAVAYGAALGARAGWLVAAGGVALAVLLLWVTAPSLRVTSQHLQVDSARLPLTSVDRVEAVDAVAISALRGPGGDARLFVALRPWSSPRGVLVRLVDTDDPHPAWLFSSRHPDRVVRALAETTGR